MVAVTVIARKIGSSSHRRRGSFLEFGRAVPQIAMSAGIQIRTRPPPPGGGGAVGLRTGQTCTS